MAQDTSYGVMTLFQSDIPGNNLPSGYNTPERLEFVKSWIDQASAIGSEVIRIPGDWIGLEGAGKGQYSEARGGPTYSTISAAI